MNKFNEDIFGNNADVKLLLRYGTQIEPYFNKANKILPFGKILEILQHKERKCYFLRKDDKQHKIIVPISETPLEGQLEIVAEWSTSNSYEIKVNKNKKTKFSPIKSSIDPKYSIEQICEFVFLKLDEPYTDFVAQEEMYRLYERVSRLEIAPATQIENERELWTKFVYAEQLQIDKLSEPFLCEGTPSLIPIKNKKEEVTKYKVIVPIKPICSTNEYDELITECRESFKEEISINPHTGKSEMTEKQILDVDTILQRKLQNKYERVPEMACILPIEQLSIQDLVYKELSKSQSRYYVEYLREMDKLFIFKNNTNVPRLPYKILSKYNLKIVGVLCRYIKKDEYGKSFNEDEPIKFEDEQKLNYVEKIAEGMDALAKEKENEWIKNNDYVSVQHIIGCIYSYAFDGVTFDDNFWDVLQRELYNTEYTISKKNKTISFNFCSFDQLPSKITFLLDLNLFKLKFNPIKQSNFRFKITYKYIKGKNDNFVERREKLKNVAFVAEIDNPKGKRNKELFIGTLNGYESNDSQLVFNLPYFYPEDKKIAKGTKKYFDNDENQKKFICVHADLKGDKAKTKWLIEAVDKLSESRVSSTEPNSKPINPRLRDFIFDSSKATPTYKFELNDIKESEEYRIVQKQHLLALNESQLHSVIKALYAEDMCLLQGPPGTGKTTVIAELIWQYIIKNSLSRLLVTSETNLAVDNALEKLMNGRNVSMNLSRYLTIIKPLRFGRALKFEEEGKRFSVERIEKWLNDEWWEVDNYENEMSSIDEIEQLDNTDNQDQEDYSHNAVQDWMNSIANRVQCENVEYESVLKEYTNELRNPSSGTKRYFKDKYFQYANVIGSTCSSTGSPAFVNDFARVQSLQRYKYYIESENYNITISDIRNLIIAKYDVDNFAGTAESIVQYIIKENNIKKEEDLEELLSNPTEAFKRFLFDYELNNVLRESKRPNSKKLGNLIKRLGFETIEEFNQFCTISFDIVIMDEASKATPPDLVLPLCFGKKAIIIGDHRQLPPMLHDKDFKTSLYELDDPHAKILADEIDREFTDTSQFSRLIQNPRVSPSIKSVFSTQYRMHPQINDVISQFYLNDEGGLHCGLSKAIVDSANLDNAESRYHGFEHIGFISNNIHTLWVNVDGPEQRAESGALFNDAEVEAVKRVLAYLKHSNGFDEYMSHWDNIHDIQKINFEKEVGIISFYSKQVSKLREAKAFANKLGIRVKLNTVDKFQGMERNIIIVSTVRSSKKMRNGEIIANYDSGFAKSPERLNVALSRAKRLLIVVGDNEFFNGVRDKDGNFLYRNVINEIQKHSEIINYKSLTKYIYINE